MPSPLDLLNVPRKRKDDYFEFIALSGKHEAFDLDKAEPFLSRPDLRRCEIMFHIKGDRWVLTYVPFPGDVPPWVDSQSGSDELDLWERPCPPNRELGREDAARWFQLINERELPEGLEPVAESQERERELESTRLDHAWRPPSSTIVTTAESRGATGAILTLPAAGSKTAPSAASPPSSSELNHGTQVPVSGKEKRTPDLEDRALALLVSHRDWSNVRLAEALGCHPKSLSRLSRFRNARSAIKAARTEIPRGRRDAETGSLEAWDER